MVFEQHCRLVGSRNFLDQDVAVHRDAVLVNRSDQVAAVDVGCAPVVVVAADSVVAGAAVVESVAASLDVGTRDVVAVAASLAVVVVAAAAVVVVVAAVAVVVELADGLAVEVV